MSKKRKCCGCNAWLVSRDGRYGEFMACPNWPKCRASNTYPEHGIQIDPHWEELDAEDVRIY